MSSAQSRSWLEIAPQSPFSLANIPFGIVSTPNSSRKVPATIVGQNVIVLSILAESGAFANLSTSTDVVSTLQESTLNDFAALGREVHRKVRAYMQDLLREDTPYPQLLRDNGHLRKKAILDVSGVENHLPLQIGDYTDFYVGLNHAYNVGCLFRGPANALQPNYLHLPVGYHGRASSIRVSGTPVRRPNGQFMASPTDKQPTFGPCRKLDIEVELAAFVCKGNEQGRSVGINDAKEHIFGYILMNDWSARDIQAWEYVPLGPFNSKNFATTISPWVVLSDALEPHHVPTLQAENQDKLLPYLRGNKPAAALDLNINVELSISGKQYHVAETNASNLVYSFDQLLAHHTVGGCNLNPGDLIASGTISGLDKKSLGSFLEMTANGKEPLELDQNLTRTFLADGDEVIMTGETGQQGALVGFGECRAKILPAFGL